MPRSIFAILSWWRRIIVVIAIAPPTRIALIGTSSPPKLRIESTILFIRHLPPYLRTGGAGSGRDASTPNEPASRPHSPLSMTKLLFRHHDFGGADRDRTGGLLVANQALSQLSYSPLPQWSVVSIQWSVWFLLITGH